MKKNKEILLLLIISIVSFCLNPMGIEAKSKKVSGNIKCANRVGIDITATKYNRVSKYANGNYINEVHNREITIKTASSDYNYKLITYKGDVGTLEDLDDLKTKTARGNDVEYSENTFKGEIDPIVLEPGKEILVVVLLESSPDGTVSSTDKCDTKKHVKTTKSDGSDKKYCCTGNLVKKESDSDNVTIEGVAASMFVQNPSGDGLYVENLRASNKPDGTACKNAKEGINTRNKNDSIKSENIADWEENYYKKLLSYCEIEMVPYNLENKDITNISNKLIELYNKQKKLEAKSVNGFNDIDKEISAIKQKLTVNNYYILDKTTGVGEGNANVLDTKLMCDDKNIDEKLEYKEGFGQEEYLYAETQTEKATIKVLKKNKEYDTTTIDVCDTKCYENLTVIYSPPKAVKAGLCFQYKVTVKSVTKCGVKVHDAVEKLKDNTRDMCSPNPVCENDEKKTQAGPSEEFDSCIMDCDNGEYSQNCINKCYDKVYRKNKKENNNVNKKVNVTINKNTDINKLTPTVIIDKNTTDDIVKNIADFDEKKLENYYKKPIEKCENKNILSNIDYCAEYFYKAKTLYPMGEYDCNNEGKCTWSKYSEVNNYKYKNDTEIESIAMQIARSSPFYVRSVPVTKELIQGLFTANKIESAQRKYYIDNDGIKVQTSKSGKWTCEMECEYRGCTNKDALTSEEYTKVTKENLDSVNAALTKCDTTAACDTSEKTTNFTINIGNNRKKSKQTVTNKGDTELHSPEGKNENTTIEIHENGKEDSTTIDCPDTDTEEKLSMFVPADNDINTTTGILGYCFDDKEINGSIRLDPHYQTTITIPGSWRNLKNKSITYCQQTEDKYIEYKNKYCTPFDSKNVNEDWFKWAMHYTSEYPQDFKPEYNITASAKKFGKYNWTINYSCFYAMYDKAPPVTDIPPTGIPGENPGDPSTDIENHSFRIVDNDEFLKAQTENGNVGFNWTKEAQIKSIDTKTASENAKTYAINPERYKEYVQKQGNSIYNESNKKYEYHLYLSKNNLKEIKKRNKDFTYTSFGGEFKHGETGVKEITTYRSNIIDDPKYVTLKSSNRDDIIGKNNDYGAELEALLNE